jgi:hypothetical protein
MLDQVTSCLKSLRMNNNSAQQAQKMRSLQDINMNDRHDTSARLNIPQQSIRATNYVTGIPAPNIYMPLDMVVNNLTQASEKDSLEFNEPHWLASAAASQLNTTMTHSIKAKCCKVLSGERVGDSPGTERIDIPLCQWLRVRYYTLMLKFSGACF